MLHRYTFLLLLLAFGTSLSAQFNFNVRAICHNQTNYASVGGCDVTIDPAAIDGGSYTSFGNLVLTVSPAELPLGTHEVTLTATNFVRTSSCRATVLVEDKTPPNVACLTGLTVRVASPLNVVNELTPGVVLVGAPLGPCYEATAIVSVAVLPDFGPTTYTVSIPQGDGNSIDCWGTVEVQPQPVTYCPSAGDTGYEYIDYFGTYSPAFGSWRQNSGNNAGAVYFPTTRYYYPGNSVRFNYGPGFVNGSFTEYWRVYIDLNGDGDFNDAEEMIHQWSGNTANYSPYVNIPDWGYYGPTRMRVVMSYDGYQSACANGFWGETEDYRIEILDPSGARAVADRSAARSGVTYFEEKGVIEVPFTERLLPPARKEAMPIKESLTIYPNPVRSGGVLNVTSGAGTQVQKLVLKNVVGNVLTSVPLAPNQARVALPLPDRLPAGIYLITGVGEDGRGVWSRRVMVGR